MADFYAQMGKIADQLLTRFNQGSVQIVRFVSYGTGPEHSPGAPVTKTEMLTGATVKGVSSKYIMRGLAVEGDLEIVMKGSVNPNIKDTFIVNSIAYKAVSIQATPASGTPVVFRAIVRRS